MNKIKVVILAGGMGTRMWQLTHEGDKIPKPLLPIGSKSILEHIIDNYRQHGIRDFIICSGYQSAKIEKHFQQRNNSDYSDCNIAVVNTGLDAMTGGRIMQISHLLEKDEPFLLSYGDALSDINISELLNTHISSGVDITLSIKEHQSRFGEVIVNPETHRVQSFIEKRKTWISIGFFVVNQRILSMLKGNEAVFEKDVLETYVCAGKDMNYYIHNGFWECMDTVEEYQKQLSLGSISKLS